MKKVVLSNSIHGVKVTKVVDTGLYCQYLSSKQSVHTYIPRSSCKLKSKPSVGDIMSVNSKLVIAKVKNYKDENLGCIGQVISIQHGYIELGNILDSLSDKVMPPDVREYIPSIQVEANRVNVRPGDFLTWGRELELTQG